MDANKENSSEKENQENSVNSSTSNIDMSLFEDDTGLQRKSQETRVSEVDIQRKAKQEEILKKDDKKQKLDEVCGHNAQGEENKRNIFVRIVLWIWEVLRGQNYQRWLILVSDIVLFVIVGMVKLLGTIGNQVAGLCFLTASACIFIAGIRFANSTGVDSLFLIWIAIVCGNAALRDEGSKLGRAIRETFIR